MVAPGLVNHVHAVVIARAVLAGRHKSLRFVRPKNEQIVYRPFRFWFVKTAQGVVIEQQFSEGAHVTPLGPKLLRHGQADDFTPIDVREFERALRGAEHLRHLRRQEVLQIVADGFADAAKLFFRLVQEAVREVFDQGRAPRGQVKFR